MSDQRKATPAETLERHIVDPCIPKSEAEWWAHREIEKQREESKNLRAEIARLRAEMLDLAEWCETEDPLSHKKLSYRLRAALEVNP